MNHSQGLQHQQLIPAYFYLTILHQNDIHSHFDVVNTRGYRCLYNNQDECFGGFSRAVYLAKSLIHEDKFSKNPLIVNAGDFFKGNQYYSEFKWRLAADMIQHMPYTALALGDAEFTDGLEGLVPFLRAIGEKFVCTNIEFSGVSNVTLQEELRRLCPRHRIISYENGKRHVCLLGYTTPRTIYLMTDTWAQFENEEHALTREIESVRKSRPDVKIFVALGHSGYQRDKQIAHRVPSLDVIVGGHSHTLLWPNIRNKMVAGTPEDEFDKPFAKAVYPTVVIQPGGRTVLIVQMYRHGKYLGVLNVTFNADDEVVDYYALPRLLTSEIPKDPAVEKSLEKYRQEMKQIQQQIIGRTLVELKGDPMSCSLQECNLGNLVTEAVLWHLREGAMRTPRTMVAIINSGAMKTDIMPGKLKMADITGSLPFPDTVRIVELRGSTIRKMLEHSLKEVDVSSYNFLQMTGMRARYDISKPAGQRVESVHILCHNCVSPRFEPLNDSAAYHVAMFSYIADGISGFTMVKQEMLSSQQRHDVSLEIIVSYVKHFSPLHPYIDGRIDVVSAPAVNSTGLSRHRWREYRGTTAAVAGCVVLLGTLTILW